MREFEIDSVPRRQKSRQVDLPWFQESSQSSQLQRAVCHFDPKENHASCRHCKTIDQLAKIFVFRQEIAILIECSLEDNIIRLPWPLA
jgi:hypothetical protein